MPKTDTPVDPQDPKNAKRERQRQAKEERYRQLRQIQRRDMMRKGLIALVAFAVMAGAGYWLVNAVPEGAGESGTGKGPRGTQSFQNESRSHVQGTVDYPETPPSGGDHAGVWQNCGAYEEPIGTENGVHTLEHGAVWVTYQPELDEAPRQALATIADEQSFVLVSPFRGLTDPIVVTAWDRQLRLTSADDPRLLEFIQAFRNGPTTPELGAACTGGIG